MFPWFPLDRLDRYALRLIAGPLALSLMALLLAQLLERLLRLFDLAASAGAAPSSVLVMAATLVPHYLGLALPMAFTAALFMAAAHLCDENELDVMLVAGRSIARIAAPYFMIGLMLGLFSVYLYGQLQPLARYGYHVAVNRVLETGWDARVEENRFIDIGQGFTFTADVIEGDGRDLRGVFIERHGPGREEVLTAASGRLVHTPDGLQLQLHDGQIVRERERPITAEQATRAAVPSQDDAASAVSALAQVDAASAAAVVPPIDAASAVRPAADGHAESDLAISITRFVDGVADRDQSPGATPLAARGDSVRERTLPELWKDMHVKGASPKVAAEFHARLARSMVFPLLPLLALPLGMASKRGRRAPGVVFAVVALLAIHHALQLGESLADTGRLPAAVAVWTPFTLFALTSLWIFRSSLAWPGDNPVLRAVMAIEALVDRARARSRPQAAT